MVDGDCYGYGDSDKDVEVKSRKHINLFLWQVARVRRTVAVDDVGQ